MNRGRPLLIAALAVVVIIGAAWEAPPAMAAPIRECGRYAPGGGAGVYNITTRVTACRIARRMARNFYRGRAPTPTTRRGWRRPWRWGSYRCINRSLGYELSDLRCTASRGRVVRWQHGA